ncbi:IGF-like family receptor 1 isoform X1 [Petromyzon marinus]|uniref:IGF-like family receptor 1 isoform X1 n=1 Tax=Petromyzon marinus TaxID=7757 RepID=UPI003F7276A3
MCSSPCASPLLDEQPRDAAPKSGSPALCAGSAPGVSVILVPPRERGSDAGSALRGSSRRIDPLDGGPSSLRLGPRGAPRLFGAMGRPRCQDHEFPRGSVCVSCSSAVPLTPGFGYTKHCGHASPEGGPPAKRCGLGEFTGGLGLCEPCSRCGGLERVAEGCTPAKNTRCCPEGKEAHLGSCRSLCCDCSRIRGAEGGSGRDPECVGRERFPFHCHYSKAATCRVLSDTPRLPMTPTVLTLGRITRIIEVPPLPPSPPSPGLQGAAAAGGSEAMLLLASLALSSMLLMLLVLLATRGPRCWRGRPPNGARGAQDTRGQGSLESQRGDLKPQGEASAGDQNPMLDTHTQLREESPQRTREQELTERIHTSPWFSLPLERLLDALDVCDRLSQLLDPEQLPLASARHLASRCGLERREVAALAARGVSLTRAALEVTAARDPGVTVGSLLESLLRMDRADALQVVLGAAPPPRHGAGLGFGADLSAAANTGNGGGGSSGDTGTSGTSSSSSMQCGCSVHVNGSAYSNGYARAKGSVTSGAAHTVNGRAALPDETTRPSNGCAAHTCV